jgi:Fe-S-cluster containining protein
MGDSASLPCLNCHASCCQYPVPMTALDAVRMQRDLGRPLPEFTTLSDRDPDGVGFRLRRAGPRLRIMLSRRTTVHLRGWCVFFDPDQHPGGCTSYAARPAPCRVYPATLRYGRVELRDPAACPAGAWTADTPLWGDSWRRTVRRAVIEQLIDQVINTAWNRAVAGTPRRSGDEADDVIDDEPDPGDEAAFRRYLDWVGEVCGRLDEHTGCLDRSRPLAPEAVAAAKAMLRRG